MCKGSPFPLCAGRRRARGRCRLPFDPDLNDAVSFGHWPRIADATRRRHLASVLVGVQIRGYDRRRIPWQKSVVRTAVGSRSKSVEDRTAPQFHCGLTRTHPVADAGGRAGGIWTRSLKRPGNGPAEPLTAIVRVNPSDLVSSSPQFLRRGNLKIHHPALGPR